MSGRSINTLLKTRFARTARSVARGNSADMELPLLFLAVVALVVVWTLI
jgi:hypothetical protein